MRQSLICAKEKALTCFRALATVRKLYVSVKWLMRMICRGLGAPPSQHVRILDPLQQADIIPVLLLTAWDKNYKSVNMTVYICRQLYSLCRKFIPQRHTPCKITRIRYRPNGWRRKKWNDGYKIESCVTKSNMSRWWIVLYYYEATVSVTVLLAWNNLSYSFFISYSYFITNFRYNLVIVIRIIFVIVTTSYL